MLMYSVVLKKKISIPDNQIVKKKINGRNFLVGTYKANGRTYEAYQITK